MRRAVLLGITTTLLLSMGVGSIAASLVWQPAPVADLPASGSEETVRRFYAVANKVIATGNASLLRTVVAPHFVDSDPLPGVGPGLAGLEEHLATLYATDPGMQLVVEELIAAGDRVVARVGVRASPGSALLGGSIADRPAPWGAVESFRVAGGSIIERRSDTDALAVIRPLAEVSVELGVPAPRVVSVERFTLAPGVRWDAPAARSRLLFLEGGMLHLEMVPSPAAVRDSSIAPQAVTLATGESLVAPAGDRLGVTNFGAGAASLLAVTFELPPLSGQAVAGAEPLPSGVAAQTLARGLAMTLDVGSATVSLGRATLARDARLSLTSAAGPVLLAVAAGELEISAWGTAWVRRGVDGMSAWRAEATLADGDGLLLHPNGLVALRGKGSRAVEVVVVTVRQESTSQPGSPTT